MDYKGQERVEILTGPFQGQEGCVRRVSAYGWLTVVVKGHHPKVTLQPADVKFLHSNYFLSHANAGQEHSQGITGI